MPDGVEAGANAVEVQQEYHFLPSLDDSERSRKRYFGDDIPWKGLVKQDELNFIISRDELAYRAWKREVSVLFNRGYTIKAWKKVGDKNEPNPRLKDQLETYFRLIEADPEIRQAYSLRWQYGHCPIALTRKETPGSTDELRQPADEKADILRISGVPGDVVGEIHLGRSYTDNTYGEITEYEITMMVNNADKPVWCHANRFIHTKNEWIDNHPKGIQRLHPLYDKFCTKKTLDKAILEVPRQFARPVPVAMPTGNAKDGSLPKKEEYEAVTAGWKDITNVSYFVFPPNWDAKLLQTDGALNITPYWDATMESIAAGLLGSRFALLGAEAGAISTSDANATEFYSDMADKQTNEISPVYYELGRLGELSGQVKRADNEWWEIEWEPIWELDAKEEAEIHKLEAEAERARAATVKLYTEAGWTAEEEAGEVVMRSPGGAEVILGMAGTAPEPKSARMEMGRAAFDPVDDTTANQLNREWGVKTAANEARMSNDVQSWFTQFYGDEFVEVFNKAWVEEIGPLDMESTLGVAGADLKRNVNSRASFETQMTEWVPSEYGAYQADLSNDLIEAWRFEVENTARLAGRPVNANVIIDTNTIRQIETQGAKAAKDLFGGQHKAVMDEIVLGLDSGLSRPEIMDAIAKNVYAGTKNRNASIYKYIHTEQMNARFKTLRSYGAQKFRLRTVGDNNVRPEHTAASLGPPGDESDFMHILSDYGCRCYIIPVTVYDQALADQQAAKGEVLG